ncbi:MAG: hypothetical protein LW875_08105, partial [Proteobacteria bacterium]|nr:hypothetical protein [Pseudomonadota bacterium]
MSTVLKRILVVGALLLSLAFGISLGTISPKDQAKSLDSKPAAPVELIHPQSSPPPSRVPISDSLLDCLDLRQPAETLNQIFEKLVPSELREKADVRIENWLGKTRRGQELRLHFRLNDVTGQREVLLFTNDEEGFPKELSFPRELAYLQEKISWYQSTAVGVSVEKRQSYGDKGRSIDWSERDGVITQMEVVGSSSVFSCSSGRESCICKQF